MTTKTKIQGTNGTEAKAQEMKQDPASLAEPWMNERLTELGRLVGQQSFDLDNKRRELEEIRDTIDRLQKEGAALEAEIRQREQVREKNQNALNFIQVSLNRLEGER